MAAAPVTDPAADFDLVDEERREAVYVALWAHRELERTPGWRWLRRRYLDGVFERQAAYSECLKEVLQEAERRGAWKSDGSL